MKKTVYFAAAIAAILCLSVNVSADSAIFTPRSSRSSRPYIAPLTAVAEAEAEEAPGFTLPEDTKILRVTSSVAYTADDDVEPDASPLYDADPETAIILEYEPTFPHWLSVRMATGVPQTLSGFAYILDGEPGTVVTIRMFATNDATQSSWTSLGLKQEAIDDNGWKILTIDWDGEAEKYAFYRLDILIEDGDTLTLSEVRLLKPAAEPDYAFTHPESVEVGEFPPVVEIDGGTAAKDASAVVYRGILPCLRYGR